VGPGAGAEAGGLVATEVSPALTGVLAIMV